MFAWNGTKWDDTGAKIPARAVATVWHDPAHHLIGIYGGLDGQGNLLKDLNELAGTAHVLLGRQLVSALADETCNAGEDADGDGAMGCADPDCWATCWPACPLATSCP